MIPVAESKIPTSSTLLWQNPSPSASFSAQTIPLDLSKYRFVYIETASTTAFIRVGKYAVVYGNGYPNIRNRSFTVNTNGVIVSEGFQNGSVDNGAEVPQRIYGIDI